MKSEKIVLGSDHGGFELKEKLRKWLEKEGHSVKDVGCFNEESVDYPEFGAIVARQAKGKKIGIAVCGTGIGICMAANKVKGARAALVFDAFTGKMAREHNNANVLCFGGRTTSFVKAKSAVNAFLERLIKETPEALNLLAIKTEMEEEMEEEME